MAIQEDFTAALAKVKTLPNQSNDVLLKLYGLYKQSSDGDVSGKRPGRLNLKGRAKYDAWDANKGTSSDDAKQAYIDLVGSLG